MTEHDETSELLGAYALDAVSDEEARAVEEHLRGCPRCRAELAGYREVAAMLGDAGGVAPEGVWARIASELEFGGAPSSSQERAVPPPGELLERAAASSRRVELRVLGSAATSAAAAGGRSGRTRAGSRLARRWPAIAIAAIGSVAAALAIVVGVLSSRVDSLDHEVSAVQSAVTSRSLAALALAASLDPADAEVRLSAAAPAAPSARLIVERPSGIAFFVGSGLARLPGDRTYQLWSLVGGKPVSLGVLGSQPLAVEVHLASNMSVFMVTAEPEGGTRAPTGSIVVQGSLPRTS